MAKGLDSAGAWNPVARHRAQRRRCGSQQAAFNWGRLAAIDPDAVRRALGTEQVVQWAPRAQASVDELATRRKDYLTAYQNADYAAQYVGFVERYDVPNRPWPAVPTDDGRPALTAAVARYLFKLMGLQDEYEVARLHTDTTFLAKLDAQFEGTTLNVPPGTAPVESAANAGQLPTKRRYGAWMQGVFGAGAPQGPARWAVGRLWLQRRTPKRARFDQPEYRAAIESMLPCCLGATVAAAFARMPGADPGLWTCQGNLASGGCAKQWDGLAGAVPHGGTRRVPDGPCALVCRQPLAAGRDYNASYPACPVGNEAGVALSGQPARGGRRVFL